MNAPFSLARHRSSIVRSVPATCTTGGMTLVAPLAMTRPIDSTVGIVALLLRLTTCCSDVISAAAATTDRSSCAAGRRGRRCRVYFYPQFVARSHVLFRCGNRGFPTAISGATCSPDECDHPVIAERVFCHDHRRASGANLFAGLEQPEHGSGDLRFVPVQHEQRAEQAGGVHVVPRRRRASLRRAGRRIRVRFPPDRQRVRVGPEHHAALQVAVPFDARQDTRSGDPAEQDSLR